MSTRFEAASSERASRASFAVTTAFTFGGYFYLHALPTGGNYAPLISLYGSFAGFWVGVNSSGRLVIYDYNSSTFTTATTTTISTGTWYYLWGRQASTFAQMSLYLNASTTAELTTGPNVSVGTMTLQFGTNEAGYDTNWFADASLDAWKLWNLDRAASNAATEDDGHVLASSTSAIGEYWFDGTDITDHHTTARHLTATGTLSAGPDSPVDSFGGTAYTLTAAGGSIAISGTAAGLLYSRRVAADAGSVAISGTSATLSRGYKVAADAGAVAVTGSAASLLFGRKLAANGGSFALTGTAASLLFGRLLGAGSGSVTITGTDATLIYGQVGGYSLTADGGTFTVTGSDASLRITRRLGADAGAVAITGTAASLLRGMRLHADSGAVTIGGQPAALLFARRLSADAGAYLLIGTAADLRWSGQQALGYLTAADFRILPALSASVTLTTALSAGPVTLTPALTAAGVELDPALSAGSFTLDPAFAAALDLDPA